MAAEMFLKHNRPDLALTHMEVLATMRDSGIPLRLLDSLCQAYLDRGRVDRALAALEKFTDKLESSVTQDHRTSFLTRILARASQDGEAAKLLIKSIEDRVVVPSEEMFVDFVKKLTSSPDVREHWDGAAVGNALALLRAIRQAGVMESQRSYVVLLKLAMRSSTPLRDADTIMAEARRTAAVEDEHHRNVYVAWIELCVMNGDTTGVAQRLQSMFQRGIKPDLDVARVLVDSHVSLGQPDQALLALQKLRLEVETRFKSVLPVTSDEFDPILSFLSRVGPDGSHSLTNQVLTTMRTWKIKPSLRTLKILLGAYPGPLALFMPFIRRYFDPAFQEILHRPRSLLYARDFFRTHEAVIAPLILAETRAGSLQLAYDVQEALPDDPMRSAALRAIATGLAERGQLVIKESRFREAFGGPSSPDAPIQRERDAVYSVLRLVRHMRSETTQSTSTPPAKRQKMKVMQKDLELLPGRFPGDDAAAVSVEVGPGDSISSPGPAASPVDEGHHLQPEPGGRSDETDSSLRTWFTALMRHPDARTKIHMVNHVVAYARNTKNKQLIALFFSVTTRGLEGPGGRPQTETSPSHGAAKESALKPGSLTEPSKSFIPTPMLYHIFAKAHEDLGVPDFDSLEHLRHAALVTLDRPMPLWIFPRKAIVMFEHVRAGVRAMSFRLNAGQPALAMDVFDDMLERGLRMDVYAANAALQAASLLGEDGERSLAAVWRRCFEDRKIKPDQNSFSIVIDVALSAGDVGRAVDQLIAMVNCELVPDPELYAKAFAAVWRSESPQLALTIYVKAFRVRPSIMTPMLLEQMCRALTLAKGISEALLMFRNSHRRLPVKDPCLWNAAAVTAQALWRAGEARKMRRVLTCLAERTPYDSDSKSIERVLSLCEKALAVEYRKLVASQRAKRDLAGPKSEDGASRIVWVGRTKQFVPEKDSGDPLSGSQIEQVEGEETVTASQSKTHANDSGKGRRQGCLSRRRRRHPGRKLERSQRLRRLFYRVALKAQSLLRGSADTRTMVRCRVYWQQISDYEGKC
jgi:hypothetical protein